MKDLKADFNAVGDAVTDDSVALENANACDDVIYIPYGTYKCNSLVKGQLTATFFGPGIVIYSTGDYEVFQDESDIIKSHHPMVSPVTGNQAASRSLVFIGDSITTGYPVGYAGGFPKLILDKINARSNYPLCQQMPFCNMDYLSSISGTTNLDASGPIGRALCLTTGASVKFSAPNLDYVTVCYTSQSTTTTFTVTDSYSSITESLTTASGTGETLRISGNTLRRAGKSCVVTITNIGQNTLIINGIWPLHHSGDEGIIPQVISYPGYTSGNFASDGVLDSIYVNTVNRSNYPVFVIALGTNDIFNAGVSVAPDVYKSNMQFIVHGIQTRFANVCSIIIISPWTPYGSSASASKGNVNEYRKAIFDVARQYQADVIDGADINLNVSSSLYHYDNLHPSQTGYYAIAEKIADALGISHLDNPVKSYTPVTTGNTILNGNFCIQVKRKTAVFNGFMTLINKSATEVLATIPPEYLKPSSIKYFSVGTDSGTCATVCINGNQIILINCPASANYLYFDGLQYSIDV